MALRRALVCSHGFERGASTVFTRMVPPSSHLSMMGRAPRTFCAGQRLPTLEQARELPTSMAHLSNESVVILAEQGSHEACYERLIREVMRVDNLEYMEAKQVAKQIRASNRAHVARFANLNYLGLFGSSFCLVACIPMVFSKNLALWFNTRYVTTEVPPPADMETIYEIGAWTWNWMEPVLGTGSFVILCMQLMRSQMQNMNFEPYTERVKSMRAESLVAMYPQYNADVLFEYAVTAPLRYSDRE